MDDLRHLQQRWQSAPPPSAHVDELVAWMRSEYHAYDIPVTAIRREDYLHDDEVRADLVDRLLTITDVDVLDRLHDDEAREMQRLTASEQDEYWRQLFVDDPDDPGDTLAYRLLLTQHALGQRTSVALEREGDHVTGFKVYGHSQPLVDVLVARVGFPARAPGEETPWPSMVVGDLEDENFAYYLRCLAAAGAI